MPIQTQFNPLTGELDVKQLPDAPDYDIAYTRAMRRRLIGALTNDGTVFPTDAESIEALSKLLADKDRQALSQEAKARRAKCWRQWRSCQVYRTDPLSDQRQVSRYQSGIRQRASRVTCRCATATDRAWYARQ